ncbi:glycosyltransferase family 4 protein [uncultured Winogradskyella sp.]|uniref:glycosyltransferase family 4 protein n=1 Tax=uncultured Winogradskyella sp. TaxID=395353 RepID=UPI002603B192|nr:glycosyltransferase family 4 protein [uncultured Winogradskyella sp.]
MKVHFLVNSLVAGGAERVLILLANYFEEQGQDVTIITFNEPEVFSANKNVKRIRLHGGKIKNHMVRSTKNLASLYFKKKNRPDVLIPFMTQTNLIGIIIGKLYGIKVVSAEHNNHLKEINSIGNFTRNQAYKYTDALTVLTGFDKKFYKSKNVNVHIMPNPSTFSVFKETERNRKKLILAVGDLNRYHHKGFDNLIPIIAPVLKKHSDWKLKLVGGGDEGMSFITNLVEKHNIADQVIFEGYSTEVAKLMSESEIYIMTSRFEGLPMVLLEAMSQGMACISFDCKTGPSDIITDSKNGILIEDQNFDAMSNGLDQLINNPEQRKELAANGINSLDNFKIDVIYNKYLDIFESIL